MADFFGPDGKGYEEEDLAYQTGYVEPCSDADVSFEVVAIDPILCGTREAAGEI